MDTVLEPFSFLKITTEQLRGKLSLEEKPLRILLTAPEGVRVWDSLWVGGAADADGATKGTVSTGSPPLLPPVRDPPFSPRKSHHEQHES